MKTTDMIDAALVIGARIYYTGDAANQSGRGEVVKLRPATRFGDVSVDMLMDDGREIKGICFAMFHPTPGQRFYLASEWEAKQRIAEDEMRREYAALLERLSK